MGHILVAMTTIVTAFFVLYELRGVSEGTVSVIRADIIVKKGLTLKKQLIIEHTVAPAT
jgi:hypothetical protein